ncbi:FMN-binding protein [Arthrobacter sp. Leaf69]|uniref:FMN-binding protein n=1 Tax=Arthrobacter sp. Leaf69 TaxID=1736232 RepID=UPI0006F404B0|nr:FMN-binding protein [Arthrobacter sp. Leaf69]KQN90875.1 FMN-binding protein [Arthrobacter sp. Leaf69]
MRIRAAVSAALASAGILLAGWQSGAHVADTGSAAAAASTATSSGASGISGGAPGSSGGSPGAATTATGTFAGSAVQTRFGTVQVQITVNAGAITDVTALQLTDDDRKSVQISNRAAPLLRDEVIKAQSAQVQTISGATVTSDAYLSSLQGALDAANL